MNENKLYSSPIVKVVDIKERNMLCQSQIKSQQLGTMNVSNGSWEEE